jgi:hypothetical protein
MAYDIDYSKINGGSLLKTGGGGAYGGGGGQGGGGFGFGGQGSMTGPQMPDMTEFYKAMAERQAEKENYRRSQEQAALARQQEQQQYERAQVARSQGMQDRGMDMQHQMQSDMRARMGQQEAERLKAGRGGYSQAEQLAGLSPQQFHQMDAYGHNFWTVDPNQAKLANAQARMLGAQGDPFKGGTTGTRAGQFDSWSSDSLRAEDMGAPPPSEEDVNVSRKIGLIKAASGR